MSRSQIDSSAVVKTIDAVISERDGWKARAEEAEARVNDHVEFVNELCYALPDMQDDDAAAEALIVAEVERIVAENAELRAHIERWAKLMPSSFLSSEHVEIDYEDVIGIQCERDEMPWPCPTEVAKQWEGE